MPNFIREPKLYFEYEQYDIRMFTANSFLESTVPEEILLAILGNFEDETPEVMMEKVILRLKEVCKRKKDFQKYTFQLHVLSGLRKLHPIFNKKIKTMPILFDIDFSDDQLYLDGMEVGEKKQATSTVEYLLLQSKLAIKYIAQSVNETEAFVLSIKNRLIQEGKLPHHD
jgi:hypothetical protein